MKDSLLRLSELIWPKPNGGQVLSDVVMHTLYMQSLLVSTLTRLFVGSCDHWRLRPVYKPLAQAYDVLKECGSYLIYISGVHKGLVDWRNDTAQGIKEDIDRGKNRKNWKIWVWSLKEKQASQ